MVDMLQLMEYLMERVESHDMEVVLSMADLESKKSGCAWG